MLIAIISDTHKNQRSIDIAKKHIKEANTDIIIYLGDCIEDVEHFKEEFNGKIYAVEGNCDNLNKYPKEDILEVNGKKIYFTHGDLYGVKHGLDNLRLKGKAVGADIVLFGHTHQPLKEEKNGMLLMNPGSIAKPFLKDRCIGFIEIDDDGNLIRSELKLVKLYG